MAQTIRVTTVLKTREITAGQLFINRGTGVFHYDPAYLAHPAAYALAPSLPMVARVQPLDGLGGLSDSAPTGGDEWDTTGWEYTLNRIGGEMGIRGPEARLLAISDVYGNNRHLYLTRRFDRGSDAAVSTGEGCSPIFRRWLPLRQSMVPVVNGVGGICS